MERSSQQKKKHDISPHAAYSSLLESCMGTLFSTRNRTDPSQFKSFVFQNIFKFLNLYLVPNIYITFTFIILNK